MQLDEPIPTRLQMHGDMPCFVADSEDARLLDAADEMTDGPELDAPVWIKSEHYISAVERSAKVNAISLGVLWGTYRDSNELPLYLHGFLMITGLRNCDAAWREIKFLYDMLENEEEA